MKRKYFYVFGLVFSLLVASCNIGLGEAIDTESPKIDITSPNEGAIIRDKFAIKGTYSDDGQIKSIVLNLNNLVTGDSKTYDAIYSENAYSFTIDPLNEGIKDGNYLANVTITDTYGHVTHVSSPYTIDNTAPVIILSRPESKKGSESFEMFGQEFKLEGRAHDDNEIEIEVQVFSKDDEEKPLLTKTLKNVNRSIELTVLDAKNALEDYEKVYGEISTETNETKDLYCKIIAKDSSKRYPVSESEVLPTDNEGNKIETYYLESEFEEVIRASYSATDLYKMINGTFDASGRQVDETIKVEDIQKLLENNKVTYGQFSLNPANNPSYEVTNFNAPLNKDGKDFEGEDYKLTRGSSITVKVNSGLDGTYILGKSLGVYVSECDDEGKILDKENKIWLIKPEMELVTGEDGVTSTENIELTEEELDLRKAALETQMSVEKSKSYTFKSVELKASRNGMMLGKKYLIFVSGYDTNKTKVSNFNKDYGFYFAPKDAAPTLTVTEPSANTTYLAKGATLKVSGSSKTEMGIPEIEICVNGVEVKTLQNRNDFVSVIEDEVDLSNTSTFEYEIPASAFDQETSNEYLVSIVAKLEGKETVKEKTVSYDVDSPEILIQSVTPGIEKDDVEYLNKTSLIKGSINDSFTGLQSNTLKYSVWQDDEEKLSGAITMPSNYTITIDTEKLVDDKEMILKLYAEDKAGNVSEITETYFVDQDTDIPNVSSSDESWDAQIDTEEKLNESIASGNGKNVFISNGVILFDCTDDDGIKTVQVNETPAKSYNGGPLSVQHSYTLSDRSGRYELNITITDIYGAVKTQKIWVLVTGAAPDVKTTVTPEYFSREPNKQPNASAEITVSGKNEGAGPFIIEVISDSEDYSTVEIQGDENKESWTHSFVPTKDDVNQIVYKITDAWGLYKEETVSFKQDNTKPSVTITAVPTTTDTQEQASFKYKGTASDELAGSDVAMVEVSFDGTNWVEASGTSSWTLISIFNDGSEVAYNTEGPKTIYVRAYDNAGNYSDVVTKDFVFDKAEPVVAIQKYDDKEISTSEISVQDEFTLSGSATDAYGIESVILEQTKDKASREVPVTFENGIWTTEKLPIRDANAEIESGTYVYTVKATDKAGKVSYSTLSVLIDKEGPKVEIVTPDASYLGTAAIDKATFTFAGRAIEEIGQSGVASYSYAIVGQGEDARNWIEVPSTAENWSFTKNISTGEEPLAEGKYTLYVKAKDKAGNESAVASRNFDVDLAVPSVEVSLSSGTKATTEYFDSSFNLVGTIADSNGIASVVVKINGEETSIVDEKPNSTSYSLNKEITVSETDGIITADGTYNFEVTVTDKVGKTTTKTLSAIVDTKAPTVEFKSHANGNIVTTIPFEIEGTVSDAGSGISTEGGTFVLKQGETVIQSGALTVQANGMWTQEIGKDDTGSLMTIEGDYTIQVSLNDKAGKTSTQTVNVVYDKALPQLSVTSGNSVTTNSAFTLSGTASDSYGLKDVTIVVKGQGGEEVGETFVPTVNNDSTWTQEITVKPTEDADGLLEDGSYTVEITATDKANRKSTTQIVSVLVDTQKPKSTSVGVDENKISSNIVVYNLTQIPIKVVANDEGGSGLALVSYSVTPTVENSYNPLVLKNGEWTGYVTCDWQGTQEITVKMEDNAGNYLTKTIPVTIDTIAPDTITSSIEGTRLENGTRNVQVEISATDAGNSEGTEPYNSGVAKVEIVKIGSQKVSISGTWDETNQKYILSIPNGEISTGGVTVKVTDNANNSVENTIFTFQLDNKKPTVSITGLSDADSSTEGTQINGTVTLTGTSNDDQGLAETTPVKLYYSKDGGTTYTSLANVEGTTSWSLDIDTTTAFGSIADGTTITLKAGVVDKAGNTNETTSTVIVNQDTDRPIINLSNLDISGMTSAKGIFYKQRDLYGSITDDDGTVQSVKISLDGTDWTENIYNNGTWVYSFTEDGTTTVHFEITDKNGKVFASNGTLKPKLSDGTNKNTEDAKLYLKIDTTSPTIPYVWFRTTNPIPDDKTTEAEIKAEFETQFEKPTENGWIVGDSLSTTVIGGPESKLYVMYVAKDANGIHKTVAKLNSTSEGTQLYESATKESRVVEFSLTGIPSGNNKLEIKAHDEASGDSDVGSQARTFDLNVDNTAPEVSFGSLQNIYYGSESNSISGTMRDTNTINGLYLGLSKNDTDKPSDYLSVAYENRGQNTWTVTFDGGATNQESTSLHTEVLNEWLDSLYGEGTQNNDAVKDVWLWAYAVDEMGNTSEVEKKTIKVSPQGDKPSVTIEVPAQGDSTGGSVRISGVADIQTSNIDSVWVQIDPSYDTSTGFNNNWKSELETIITGKAVPYSIEENPQYEDESGNKKSISGINGNAAIKANGTSSWNLIINGLKEFQTDGENKLVAVRVYAVSKTGKVSEEDEVSFTIDPKSPRIGNTTPLQLVQYEADGTIKASMNYESGMWIKGNWFLIGSVEDESGISQIYWGEKNSEPRSIMGSDFVREGNPGEVINVTDAAANGAINYMLKIPVGNNTENDFGRLEYYLSVVEGGTDGKDASQTIILNYDNQAPQFTAKLNKTGNEIYQSDGTYSVSGTFEETSSGVNNQSGFNRIAMFFERSYTKDGVTTKYLVDPMLEGGDSGTANRYPISEFENKNNLYWRTAEADITNEGIVFDSLPTNVRVGGLCMIKDVIYRIQTVRGNVITIDKPIVNQNDVTVYFALAQVIDNTIVESGLTKAYVAGSEDKEDDDHINGDGDQMIEKANITGSTCNWQASIDSSLIYDGPITIRFVAFDAAGNMTCDDFSGNVSNNAPRIAGVSFGTDNNGDEEISTDEMITAYSGWYDIESPNKQTGVTQSGKKANGQNVSVFNVGYNEYDDKWETSLVVKGDIIVVPEIVGGNTGLGYSVMQGNTSVKEYADYEGVVHSADGKVRDENLLIKVTVKDFLRAYEENTDEVDGVKNFTFSIWDKTEGTTPGVDSQHADINIQMNVMLQDIEAPKVSLIPFYWKGKTENSLYENSRENGHIELEGDLDNEDFDANTNSGLYDKDPKVSGKITIEGTASDNVLLMELGVKTEYKFNVENNTSEFDDKSYKPIAQRVDGTWKSQGTLADNGWQFEAVEETFSQEGNTLKWKLHLDTEKVEKVAQTDFILYVQAIDRGSAYLDGDKNLKYAYDAPTNEYKPKTAETTRKMDIVPYITGVQTWLVNELKTSIRDAYSRTALGHYIINENEGNITLTGFNLDGNTTIASSAATTGAYSVSVNGVESLNNKNNNNAKGSYTEEMQESCSYEDKDNFAYNRLANGRTNNLLTDDIYFDVWEFDSDAAIPESGKLSEPVMKINPVTGKVGFAFVSGPAHFSMGAGTGNSYETYQRNYATFSNISFAYDDNGNSYGTATGLDTYPDGATNTLAGRFTFMTNRWGKDIDSMDDNYNYENKIRFEAIGLPGADNCYVKGVYPNSYTMTETRFYSPSMAVTTHNNAATVYLAYYDDVQDQIRFRYGTVGNGRGDFNNFVDNEGLGSNSKDSNSNWNQSRKYVFESDTKNFSLIAGADWQNYANRENANTGLTKKVGNNYFYDTGYEADAYVAIDVVKGTSADKDVVVAVWYDGKDCYYAYNTAPHSGKDNGKAGGWTTKKILSGGGEYCTIKVDSNKGIHIAANVDGALKYAYLSSYDASYTEATQAIKIDSCAITGEQITIDVGKKTIDNITYEIPYISYYMSASKKPCIAYITKNAISNGTMNYEAAGTDENDCFTGNWEVSVIPAQSQLSGGHSDKINVGLWKDTNGTIINSYCKTANGTVQNNTNENNTSATSSGNCYGNGTANPIFGYAIKSTSGT
ncbi:MAG: Ig-like domain repeat protein, partial [Treponema sp.]|nr:Ig-like domain repeat protein [Treponema sp.]